MRRRELHITHNPQLRQAFYCDRFVRKSTERTDRRVEIALGRIRCTLSLLRVGEG